MRCCVYSKKASNSIEPNYQPAAYSLLGQSSNLASSAAKVEHALAWLELGHLHSAESVWRLIVADVVGLSNKVLIGDTDLGEGREVDHGGRLGRVAGVANRVVGSEGMKSRTLLAEWMCERTLRQSNWRQGLLYTKRADMVVQAMHGATALQRRHNDAATLTRHRNDTATSSRHRNNA